MSFRGMLPSFAVAESAFRRPFVRSRPYLRVLVTLGGVALAAAAVLPSAVGAGPERGPLSAAGGMQSETTVRRTFFPVADTYVRSDRPRAGFGRSRTLVVEGHPVSRAFVRFRPSGEGALVQARLRLFVVEKVGRFTIHRTRNTAWGERVLTYRSAPRLTPVAGYPEAKRRGWMEFDVTSFVQLNRPVTIVIARKSPQKLTIASRESGGHAPRLIVESGQPGVPVVAAAGDVACGTADPHYDRGLGTPRHCRGWETAEILQALRPAAVLGLGDNLNSMATYEEFLATYGRTWGRLKNVIRPVPGNWEYAVPGAAGYFRYFGAAAGDPQKGYYSFDLGSWHVVALNSNCREIGGCDLASPQGQWLLQDLAASAARCTVAYMHDPRFVSGSSVGSPRLEPLWRVLAGNRVEIVLSGGRHFYERLAPLNADGAPDAGGLRQFVVGTGGHSTGDPATKHPMSVVRNGETFGVLRLTLRPNGYDWRFVAEAGRSFTDRGSASCR